MSPISFRFTAALLGLLLCSPLPAASEEGGGSVLPDIAGTTWVRTNAPPFEGEEGLHFDKDGTLGLVGFSSMSGLTWKRRKNELNLATNTTFRPQPEESELFMVSNDGQRLVLSGKDDYLAGPWYRDDAAVGVLPGQVSGVPRAQKDGGLHLELREMQPDGTVGRLIARQNLPLEKGKAPPPFRLYFPGKEIRPDAAYAVAAVITEGRTLRYFTPPPAGVRPGEATTVTIPLSPAP
jgi:hypothetical protein